MKRALALLMPFIAGIAADRFLIPTPVQAQTRGAQSLTIDNTAIWVGMSKAEALAALSGYTLSTPTANGRSAIVAQNTTRDGVVLKLLGSITINNATVAAISRDWGEAENSPEVERLWKSFWGAMTANISDSRNYIPLSARAYTQSSPQGQWQTIDLLVGANHVVSIQRSELFNGILASPSSGAVLGVSVDETVF